MMKFRWIVLVTSSLLPLLSLAAATHSTSRAPTHSSWFDHAGHYDGLSGGDKIVPGDQSP